jgi:hypothetical protein
MDLVNWVRMGDGTSGWTSDEAELSAKTPQIRDVKSLP